MRVPRDIGASDLIRALRILGFERVRQDGSHIRLTTSLGGTHLTGSPAHWPLIRLILTTRTIFSRSSQ